MSRLPRLLRSLETIALSLLRIVYSPKRAREFLAYAYLYRPLPYSPTIICDALPGILIGVERMPVALRKCFPQHGNMTGEEIINLCLLVRWTKPRGIFEFGTFDGTTTLQMAVNAPDDCRVFTLNLPPNHSDTVLPSSEQDKRVHPNVAGSGQAFQDEPEKTRIVELFGDSAIFDFTPYHERSDFVFVDAGHEYEYVKSDTNTALKLLPREGGIIAWHDFPNAPGVCAWLEELSRKMKIYHIKGTRLAFTIIGRPSRCGAKSGL